MDERLVLMIEISKLIKKLNDDTDIYYLQQQCKVDLTGPMQATNNALEIIIDRLR